MTNLIEQHRSAIEKLCIKHHVARLELFGSGTHDESFSTNSDLDFLATFQSLSPSALADAFFGLQADLSRVFNRTIDLITPASLRNPYFKQAVDESRQLLYAA